MESASLEGDGRVGAREVDERERQKEYRGDEHAPHREPECTTILPTVGGS